MKTTQQYEAATTKAVDACLTLSAPLPTSAKRFGPLVDCRPRSVRVCRRKGATTAALVGFDLGYVLTMHKAQGSQWDDVVLFDESGAFADNRDRWLYTGVTRAAKRRLTPRRRARQPPHRKRR